MAIQRLLQNGSRRLLQSSGFRLLEGDTIPIASYIGYPMQSFPWGDRFGITKPDVTGPMDLTKLSISPLGTGNYDSLVISADGAAGQIVGIALVLWDDRGNPISVNTGAISLSSWANDGEGNFVASNGYGITPPGFLSVDVSFAAGYTILVQSFGTPNVPMLGTVTTTANSPLVVGVSTGFVMSNNVIVGKPVIFSGDTGRTVYKVLSVADSFHLTLTSPALFSGAGQTMTLVSPVNLHWKLF